MALVLIWFEIPEERFKFSAREVSRQVETLVGPKEGMRAVVAGER